ncbi:MAG: hypothetical protein Q8O86_00385, partial [Dehalococcoidia bacterium]|nr:hypothetical protein [Dehalococcoidia bacterium]
MDIDLLGRIEDSLEVIVAAMKEACGMDVEVDGMSYNEETVTAARITEDADRHRPNGLRSFVLEGREQKGSMAGVH